VCGELVTRRSALPACAGLVTAWGGAALLASPAGRLLGDPVSLSAHLLGQAAVWALCAAVLGILFIWEGESLRSIWLRPPHWTSLAWAGVLVVGHVVLLFPATEWIRKRAGLSGYAGGMQLLLGLPVWFRAFAALTAGIVEEVLFRGYAVTRLLLLTGSLTTSVIVSSAVFAILHLPVWGAGPTVAFLVGGLATTAFFAWRRDLLAMIIAHAVIDTWGLLVAPALGRWWL
jgi:membrane protease YdiL (CAAX protease family)